ncbi:MAG: ACP phosphodiesterase [Pseudomonadota bacterium]
MNYLAHVVLSGPDPQWQLGGYLGDHVRGRGWADFPTGMASGILLHRQIDVYTDAHTAFAAARQRLDPAFRRYAGILLDMFFDHFLAGSFDQLTGRNLSVFAGVTYGNLRAHWHVLPPSLQRFARYQERHNLLTNYADEACLAQVLKAVSGRFKRANPLAEGLGQLQKNRSDLEASFLELFKDLQAFAIQRREALSAENPIRTASP